MKIRFSNWVWGTFLLLAAALIISNQFNGFVSVSAGSVIAASLALAFFVQCVAGKSFALLPIPVAVLYIIFQSPLELPHMEPWVLIFAAVIAAIGLAVLLPPGKYKSGVNIGCVVEDVIDDAIDKIGRAHV